MSSPFSVFQTKHKASKPTRFKTEKIQERREKPQFLKVHLNKTKNVLEASGFLTGTLQSAVDNIVKHKRSSNNVDDLNMYYNVTLMVAGIKKDLEKFLKDNLPHDTTISPDLKDSYLHLGPIPNFNARWLKPDMSAILTYEEALTQFADLRSSVGDQYDSTIAYYLKQFSDYFGEAQEKHQLAKESKEKTVVTFESLRDSLGPFKYPETGIAILKHIKKNMGEVKKKETKRTVDTTFDKYFFSDTNNVIRVSLTNNSKGGSYLSAKKEAASNITNSQRSKAFQPFPNTFPNVYFNNENIYDVFIHELRNNPARVAGTLANEAFSSLDIHILPTESDADKMAKVEKFLLYLEQEYNTVRQNRLFSNTNRQFNPIANVPVSSTLRV